MLIWPREAGQRDVAHVVAVDAHAAAGHVVEAWQQVDERALASTGGAQDRDRLPRLNRDADVAQHVFICARIAKRHLVVVHLAGQRRERARARPILDVAGRIEHLENALG
jgi:hypothetical protein